MEIRNRQDFVAGLIFVLIGATVAIIAQQYDSGTASRMGPGWFPTALGLILASLGTLTTLRSLRRSAPRTQIAAFNWRAPVLVLGAVALFALLLMPLGVVVSTAILILVSSLASHEFRLRDTLALIVVLELMAYLVFVKGLSLQFPVWPSIWPL